MSLGSNLKQIRLFRNKTLKELGQGLGFPFSSADVRIAQYESNKKKPKKDVIESLAYGLDVSEMAIDIPDIESVYGAMYTLFQLERSHALIIDEDDGEPIIRLNRDEFFKHKALYESLCDWLQESKNFKDGVITKEQYEEWKYNYPKYSSNLYNNRDREEWLHKHTKD
ncbi:helix-turn-helix domain-containing protein [Longibaculum muris]|uniref:HTH cro/C1-type domain-containing protein n=1 Tax=Longibaculum muris TaxID=1796628 RepID=A0A4R3Z8N5_9FIRM|nr:helix-turn-helix transcriptional regulator [Longibaculum muris]KXU40742.1 hypothetical protein HMPREF3037_03252 [Candidatus Stoquefichus sp. KLE1796]MCR1886962.1 helix-turn-helix domain-containing protein [Longibaculum muris]TCW02993.1 hypothetical protein EDD60_101299 [Longibaculum muris]